MKLLFVPGNNGSVSYFREQNSTKELSKRAAVKWAPYVSCLSKAIALTTRTAGVHSSWSYGYHKENAHFHLFVFFSPTKYQL